MAEVLRIDTGHMRSEGETGLTPELAAVWKEFVNSLEAGEIPISLCFEEAGKIESIRASARDIASRFENVIILGIGGSSLGGRALLQALRGPYRLLQEKRPRIFFFDNIDPVQALDLSDTIDFSRTALVYTSKSGSTPETAANVIYFFDHYRQAGGEPEQITVICDPGNNGINRLAARMGCRLMHMPPPLPGRYSVLSTVGFLPAELAGIDSRELVRGAAAVHRGILEDPPGANPVLALASEIDRLERAGKNIHVLFNYSSLLTDFGLWFMQLWAESLGKEHDLGGSEVRRGTTPLSCTGVTDQHSLLQLFKAGPRDKIYGFVRFGDLPAASLRPGFSEEKEFEYLEGSSLLKLLRTEQLATEMSLVRSGNPCYRVTLPERSAACMGALFYFYEALVAFTARLWRVNAFDQPGVEEGKHITYALMGRRDYAGRAREFQQMADTHESRRREFSVRL